ncbi:MAG: Gfo/Idh/MocA family oxidoreductase [Balneolaceae bacterium]|nr:Gfo/Idh/MocA family oxidoreductase [Balneolaceae bacterium]MCH8547642.1 Gfo/Idh/MocA family oxidoreductase [Balneolaceae bacterium]
MDKGKEYRAGTMNEKRITRRSALRLISGGAAAMAISPLISGALTAKPLRNGVKLALVGGAHIHAPDFVNRMSESSLVETKYVWDPDRGTAESRQEVSGGEIVESPEAIWDDPEVEGVVIGTETFRHMELIERAVASGKHLFVEKPVGMDGDESRKIAEMVYDAGVIFQTGYFMRSSAVNRTVKKLLDENALGDITRVRLSNVHSGAIGGWFDGEWNWMTDLEQAGVGAFGDLGCHAVDLLLWFMEGDSVESCTAHIDTVLERYPGCDEYGEGMVRFQSGAVATIAAGWVDHRNPNQIEISGTEGHLRVTEGGIYLQQSEMDASGNEVWSPTEDEIDHPLDLFFRAVAGEDDLPLVNPGEAAAVNELITAMYSASESESWVKP